MFDNLKGIIINTCKGRKMHFEESAILIFGLKAGNYTADFIDSQVRVYIRSHNRNAPSFTATRLNKITLHHILYIIIWHQQALMDGIVGNQGFV